MSTPSSTTWSAPGCAPTSWRARPRRSRITSIETADGLVNGCDAVLHSLTLPDGFDFSEHMARRAVVRDGVTEVELEAPPRSINVVPSVSAEARAALLARAASPTARPSRTASRVAARNE